MHKKKNIAIVGIGPRGISALENLVLELCDQKALQECSVSLYEQSDYAGCGPVYRANQPDANWMNVSHRFLKLASRPIIECKELEIFIEPFPSYHDWINNKNIFLDETIDVYPTRSFVGDYLRERFQSLFLPLQLKGIVDLKQTTVQRINLTDGKAEILVKDSEPTKYEEVLLTIGHQSTKNDKQLQSWENFISENKSYDPIQLYTTPYPLSQYLGKDFRKDNISIALRGFGLSTIDIIRAISEKIGTLEIIDKTTRSSEFKCEGDFKNLFVPFTLDGLPPVPKPLNKRIDQQFAPPQEHLEILKTQLSNKEAQYKAEGVGFLIEKIVPIIAEVYLNLEKNNNVNNLSKTEIEEVLTNFLNDKKFEHHLMSTNTDVLNLMKEYAKMSSGQTAFSLDFCLGQSWRHCQKTIYRSLSYNELSPEVFKDIISLDERLKRYTYGPPLESIQMLIALAEKVILNLSFLDNPDINFDSSAWELQKSEKKCSTQLMINSVLDSPKLSKTVTAVITNLLEDDLVQVAHDDLGILTNKNAYLISKEDESVLPIALLGRLAKGTIIGVDAILECFGPRSKDWAKQAALNLTTERIG